MKKTDEEVFKWHIEQHYQKRQGQAMFVTIDPIGPSLVFIPKGIVIPPDVRQWIREIHRQAKELHEVTT